jgi:phage N-6-adenine-methyltransferase
MSMDVHYSSKSEIWETPQEFFDKLHAEHGFTLDVCATPENAKCPVFFTKDEDGLSKIWSGYTGIKTVCWMNPPYGRGIGKWVQKAYEVGKLGTKVVCLLPARTDTKWWHEYCLKGQIQFIRGRLKFSGNKWNAPFPNAVVIFGDEP